MKNCDEMTQSLIERRDEYLAEQKKKRKTAAKIITPVASLCIVALLGFGAWSSGIFTAKPPVADGESIANTNEKWDGGDVDGSDYSTEPVETPIDPEGSEEYYEEDTAIEEPSIPPTPSEDDPSGGKAQGWGDDPSDEKTQDRGGAPGPDAPEASEHNKVDTREPDETQKSDEVTTTPTTPAEPTVVIDNEPHPIPAHVETEKSDETTSAIPLTNAEPTAPAPVIDDCALMWWKNKFTVYGSLYRALTDTPEAELAVKAQYRPAVVDVTNFRYEGKTLIEWYEYDNDQMLERMWKLLKCGDELKHGEAICTTENAEGYKWDKTLYAETVAYIGEELINEYIKDGEFDSERLKADIDAYEDNDVKMYPIAYNAYLGTIMPKCAAKLTANNVRCEQNADNTLTIYVTAAQFENLPLDDLGNWTFRLASEAGYSDMQE